MYHTPIHVRNNLPPQSRNLGTHLGSIMYIDINSFMLSQSINIFTRERLVMYREGHHKIAQYLRTMSIKVSLSHEAVVFPWDFCESLNITLGQSLFNLQDSHKEECDQAECPWPSSLLNQHLPFLLWLIQEEELFTGPVTNSAWPTLENSSD